MGELDAMSTEIDHLVTHAIRYARQQGTNTRAMSALILAIDAASVTGPVLGDPRDRDPAAGVVAVGARPLPDGVG